MAPRKKGKVTITGPVRVRAKRVARVRNNPIAKPGRKPRQAPATPTTPTVAEAEIDGIMKYLRSSIRDLGVHLQERVNLLAQDAVRSGSCASAAMSAGPVKAVKLVDQFEALGASVERLHDGISGLITQLAPLITIEPDAGFTARDTTNATTAPLMEKAILLQNQIDGATYRLTELMRRLV